ncbi:MAG: DUF1634 domain-containing protein [Acidobacteriota bacterium]|nr:DUF1634 domain-containing protein [Acidobacteriota bacterium]
MDRMIGVLLRAGVLASAAITLAGGVWHYIQHGPAMPSFAVFHGEPVEFRNLSGVLAGIARGDSEALIQLGLLMLIATPIARVALCVAAFAAERDRTYVVITLVVLGVLLASAAGVHL